MVAAVFSADASGDNRIIAESGVNQCYHQSGMILHIDFQRISILFSGIGSRQTGNCRLAGIDSVGNITQIDSRAAVSTDCGNCRRTEITGTVAGILHHSRRKRDQFIFLRRIGEERALRKNRSQSFKAIVSVRKAMAIVQMRQISGRGHLHDQRGTGRAQMKNFVFKCNRHSSLRRMLRTWQKETTDENCYGDIFSTKSL